MNRLVLAALAAIVALLSGGSVAAQDVCSNGNFENGFAGWTLESHFGNSTALGGICTPGSQSPGNQTLQPFHPYQIVPNSRNGFVQNVDAIFNLVTSPSCNHGNDINNVGGFCFATPQQGLDPTYNGIKIPGGLRTSFSGRSAQLGGEGMYSANYNTERMSTDFLVTPSNSRFKFKYSYVMEQTVATPPAASHSIVKDTFDSSFIHIYAVAKTGPLTGQVIDEIVATGIPNQGITGGFIDEFQLKPNRIRPNVSLGYAIPWTCAELDLSRAEGFEVDVYFVNSDCGVCGHTSYLYVDDVCTDCGDISLDPIPDCAKTVTGSFELPQGQNISNHTITIDVFRDGNVVKSFNVAAQQGGIFSLDVSLLNSIQGYDFEDCFDLSVRQSFDVTDSNGVITPVTQTAKTNTENGLVVGQKAGLNNDICPCPYCCDNKLEITDRPDNSGVVPVQWTDPDYDGTGQPVVYYNDKLLITPTNGIPITEIRASVSSVKYSNNYDDCENCKNYPMQWGTIVSLNDIGGLQQETQSYSPSGALATDETVREIIWSNPTGAVLSSTGESVDILHMLKPGLKIPCCEPKAEICTRISWKDANGGMCEEEICREVDLKPED